MANFRTDDFESFGRFFEQQAEDMAKSAQELVRRAGDGTDAGAEEVIRELKRVTRQKGHVRTGRLLDSWDVFPERRSRRESISVAGSPLDYAPAVDALPDGGITQPALRRSRRRMEAAIDREAIQPALKTLRRRL